MTLRSLHARAIHTAPKAAWQRAPKRGRKDMGNTTA